MEVTAILRYARISPQKCRLVADTVRGSLSAMRSNSLKFMPKKGADIVSKVLGSAVANAENNQGADVDELKVTQIHVDWPMGRPLPSTPEELTISGPPAAGQGENSSSREFPIFVHHEHSGATSRLVSLFDLFRICREIGANLERK